MFNGFFNPMLTLSLCGQDLGSNILKVDKKHKMLIIIYSLRRTYMKEWVFY